MDSDTPPTGGDSQRHHHGIDFMPQKHLVEDLRRTHLIHWIGDAIKHPGRAGNPHDVSVRSLSQWNKG
jgi:hypothetical protein